MDKRGGKLLKIYDHFNEEGEVIFFQGDCLKILADIPDDTVSLVITMILKHLKHNTKRFLMIYIG